MKAWIPHKSGISLLGELPSGVTVEVADDPFRLPSEPTGVEFWMPTFIGQPPMVRLAPDLPDLRVVQLPSAGADAWIRALPPRVTLCDARSVHDSSTAEWVVGAILAQLRRFPEFVRAQERHHWAHEQVTPTDELYGKRVLIIGAGSIGTAVAARLAPFGVTLTLAARTARPDEGVYGVADLPELLPSADVVVLLVPLTEQTRGLIDARFLAAMPDGALLVNASRGQVADPVALYAELSTGRIGAALDVTEPEPLPSDDPLWQLPNVLITPHVGAMVHGLMTRTYRLAGAQLRRYVAGEPLVNEVVNGY
ncbi:2-hydroxyacid dehydrogenase [Micromonospora sp. NPDC049523]|uniref:2-hydroxyacid dehydrogenase n=1 Tax=Micromonospora sp. NPDC049523 TaxID=3155921 RepID=UPI00341E8081